MRTQVLLEGNSYPTIFQRCFHRSHFFHISTIFDALPNWKLVSLRLSAAELQDASSETRVLKARAALLRALERPSNEGAAFI